MDSKMLRAAARDSLRGKWGISIAVSFVAGIFGALVTFVSSGLNISISPGLLQQSPRIVVLILLLCMSVASLVSFAAFLFGGTLQLGYCRFLLHQQDGQQPSFSDLVSMFDYFGAGFLQALLRDLYCFLWGLLFIIPGIVKRYSYAMTPFILAEYPTLTANQSIAMSCKMMNGHKHELFILDLTFIGWVLLSFLSLGIGNLWLNPYRNAAYAAFYRQLKPAAPLK